MQHVFVSLCRAVDREESLKSPHANVPQSSYIKLSMHTHLNKYRDHHKVVLCAFVKTIEHVFNQFGIFVWID